jgi:hypothetical protein
MTMSWQSVGYAAACVLVPVFWGVVVVWLSNRIERRVLGAGGEARHGRKQREVPPIEYHI